MALDGRENNSSRKAQSPKDSGFSSSSFLFLSWELKSFLKKSSSFVKNIVNVDRELCMEMVYNIYEF